MVKIYAKEPETALVLGAGTLIISELARVEVGPVVRRPDGLPPPLSHAGVPMRRAGARS